MRGVGGTAGTVRTAPDNIDAAAKLQKGIIKGGAYLAGSAAVTGNRIPVDQNGTGHVSPVAAIGPGNLVEIEFLPRLIDVVNVGTADANVLHAADIQFSILHRIEGGKDGNDVAGFGVLDGRGHRFKVGQIAQKDIADLRR